jgi:hypothetical protein
MKRLLLCFLILFFVKHLIAQGSLAINKKFVAIGQKAEYPGGMSALLFYLSSFAITDGMNCERAFIQFTVDEKGFVTQLSVLQSNVYVKKMADAIIGKMPQWKPALSVDNQPVPMRFTIPVKFRCER